MGFFKSLKHAVKKVGKTVTKAVKRSVNYAVRPDRLAKELWHGGNPLKGALNTASRLAGLDVWISSGSGGVTQNGEYGAMGTQPESDMTPQSRARMISRQGAQGSAPIMLLGQDVTDTDLNRDEELGGRGA